MSGCPVNRDQRSLHPDRLDAKHKRGLRLDRLLLTTDTTYLPTGEGPLETGRQLTATTTSTSLTRTIIYTYNNLYRLTAADSLLPVRPRLVPGPLSRLSADADPACMGCHLQL